jgi:hypothetical protein
LKDAIARMHQQVADAVVAAQQGARVRVPEAGMALFAAFVALHQTRTYHAAGPNPIAYAEIESFARLTGTPLRPIDVAGLRKIDEAWIVAQFSSRGGASISPAAFDAVFG